MGLFDLLRRRRDFTLPAFEPTPLEFEPHLGELILDAIVTRIGHGSQVVRLVRPMPTAGELQARIDDHLRRSPDDPPAADATEELRNALADLRRSLG